MKVLNLYAGIGGNRKLWEDCEVTAVEWDKATADVYHDLFPNDKVVVGDAHQYLLDHYKEFDFIWSSPPCPSHSDIRRCGVHKGQYPALYPEMNLYQEIILLQHFAPKECKWVVENVIPYYDSLIPPTKKMHRHNYWANFRISNKTQKTVYNNLRSDVLKMEAEYGISIHKKVGLTKARKSLRNCVHPETGLHIYLAAKGIYKRQNKEQGILQL